MNPSTKKVIGGGLIAAMVCLGLAPDVKSETPRDIRIMNEPRISPNDPRAVPPAVPPSPPTNPLPSPPGYPPGEPPPPPVILSGLAGYWSSNTGHYHSMVDVAGS